MKKSNWIAVIVLIVVFAAAGVLYLNFKPKAVSGEKEISVTVVHADNEEKTFTYKTNAEFLADVLTENDLIECTELDNGLFINTVDGETADDTQEQWWCITKAGAALTTGVDKTPIEDGDEFELTLKVGFDF